MQLSDKLTSCTEKNEPAFLRRLRGQYGDGSDERRGRSNVRPVKPKDPDADDGPTYVDEESNEVVTKEEYEAMLREAAGEGEPHPTSGQTGGEQGLGGVGDETTKDSSEAGESSSVQKLADIGAAKKKKRLGRIVAEDDQPDEPDRHSHNKDNEPPRKKQRKKKIKLAFDEQVET